MNDLFVFFSSSASSLNAFKFVDRVARPAVFLIFAFLSFFLALYFYVMRGEVESLLLFRFYVMKC